MTAGAGGRGAAAPRPLPHEVRAARWSGALFFCLLAGYYVLRPVRDLMGVHAGVERFPELFRYTLLATLALGPIFGALVARWSRRRFLPWAYRAFALQVLAFGVWAALARGDATLLLAKTYFVWLSVFNLFVVSVFWGFMADVWSPEAAKRVYGRIAVGGTAGALAGSFLGLGLRQVRGPSDEMASFLPVLFVAAALLIEAAVRCLRRVEAATGHSLGAPRAVEKPVGGGAWDGVVATVRSPFLAGVAAYVFLYTVASTVLYFVRAAAVETGGLTKGEQTDLFFWSEVCVQSVTLAVQATGTARLLALVGVGGALATAPLAVAGGAVALLVTSALVVAVGAHALGRVVHFAFAKPAAESLYTVVPRGEKYKAKSFLDTFVYRGGDWLASEGVGVLRATRGIGALPAAAIPVCGVAVVVGLALARSASRRRSRAA